MAWKPITGAEVPSVVQADSTSGADAGTSNRLTRVEARADSLELDVADHEARIANVESLTPVTGGSVVLTTQNAFSTAYQANAPAAAHSLGVSWAITLTGGGTRRAILFQIAPTSGFASILEVGAAVFEGASGQYLQGVMTFIVPIGWYWRALITEGPVDGNTVIGNSIHQILQ